MQSPWNQDKYTKAFRFAGEAHTFKCKIQKGGQTISGTNGLPYIMHPSLVCMEIIAALQMEPVLYGDLAVQCALLHDVIEDTYVKLDQIQSEFGERVASGVSALSKNRNLDESLQMTDCLNRIKQQPCEVWMVKLADRISNLQQPPADWSREKRVKYRKEAVEIHEALGSASKYLADRLFGKIQEYSQYIDPNKG